MWAVEGLTNFVHVTPILLWHMTLQALCTLQPSMQRLPLRKLRIRNMQSSDPNLCYPTVAHCLTQVTFVHRSASVVACVHAKLSGLKTCFVWKAMLHVVFQITTFPLELVFCCGLQAAYMHLKMAAPQHVSPQLDTAYLQSQLRAVSQVMHSPITGRGHQGQQTCKGLQSVLFHHPLRSSIQH